MKMKNTITAGLALAASCGAITAGILVTSGAMAASSPSGASTADLVVGTADANGDAYQCHFTDVQLPAAPTGALGAVPSGAPTAVLIGGGEASSSAVESIGVVAVSSGDAATPGSLPPGGVHVTGLGTGGAPMVVSGSVSVSADGTGTPVSGSLVINGAAPDGQLPVLDPSDPNGPKVISLDHAREGTEAECAALKATTFAATDASPVVPGAPTISTP